MNAGNNVGSTLSTIISDEVSYGCDDIRASFARHAIHSNETRVMVYDEEKIIAS